MPSGSALGIMGGTILLGVCLLFLRSLARPLNHDEHQFVTPAMLFLRDGLLPYRDYPFFHTPNLVFVYTALFSVTSHLLLAARCFNAGCAALLLTVIFAVAAWEFRHLGPRRWMIATGFFLVLALDRGFGFTAGRAWNHDLAVLAAVFAYLTFLSAAEGKRPFLWLAICGLLVGLAIGTRLSFAPLVAPFLLATLFLRIPGRNRFPGLSSYCAGLIVGLLPTLFLFQQAPSRFFFDNFTYNETVNWLYRQNTVPHEITFLNKLSFPFQELLKSPADLALVIGFIYFAFRPWVRRGWRRFGEDRAVTMLLLILPFLFLGSWAPNPSYRQYYYPFVPFLLLGNIYGMARERKFRVGRLMAAVIGVSLVLSICALPTYKVTLHPSKWPVFAAHDEGVEIRKFVPKGKILTLAPIFPLEGSLETYPEFASGPFAWRTAGCMTKSDRIRFGFVGPAELAALLEKEPPAGILTGTEHREFEQPLKAYALTHHYAPCKSQKHVALWLPAVLPEPGKEQPR